LFCKSSDVNLKSQTCQTQIYIRMSQFDSSKDYYSILGADEDASRSEIDRQYKRRAAVHHPDRGGCEEEMKALNEAYGVLKDDVRRNAYDAERREAEATSFELKSSPGAQADVVSGQSVSAILYLLLGLVLLFVVRFQYVFFLWPLALLAFGLILVGIVQAHGVMRLIRETFMPEAHPVRRYVMVQEIGFWLMVCAGGYGVYFVLRYL
jgi:hypothetical protein